MRRCSFRVRRVVAAARTWNFGQEFPTTGAAWKSWEIAGARTARHDVYRRQRQRRRLILWVGQPGTLGSPYVVRPKERDTIRSRARDSRRSKGERRRALLRRDAGHNSRSSQRLSDLTMQFSSCERKRKRINVIVGLATWLLLTSSSWWRWHLSSLGDKQSATFRGSGSRQNEKPKPYALYAKPPVIAK